MRWTLSNFPKSNLAIKYHINQFIISPVIFYSTFLYVLSTAAHRNRAKKQVKMQWKACTWWVEELDKQNIFYLHHFTHAQKRTKVSDDFKCLSWMFKTIAKIVTHFQGIYNTIIEKKKKGTTGLYSAPAISSFVWVVLLYFK